MLVQYSQFTPSKNSWDYYVPLDNENQLRFAFGNWFCDAVGIDHLLEMERVTFDSLFDDFLDNGFEDAFKIVKENRAVKGIRKISPSPFIACAIAVYDDLGHSQNHILVIAKHGVLDAYSIYNKCLDTDEKASILALSRYTKDIHNLKALFDGKKIHTSSTENEFLGMPGKSIELVYIL